MRYPDTNPNPSLLTYPHLPHLPGLPLTYPPHPPAQPTNEAIINHLIRIETRLVKLMYHVGLDANGRTREEN